MNSSSPSFLRSLAALVSVHLATLLGGILLPVAITRIAGAEALGAFTSASALALLVVTLSDWGYETELPIAVSRDKQNAHAIIRRALRVKFFLWGASSCVVALVALAQALPRAVQSSFSDAFVWRSFVPLGAYLGWALARTITNTYIGAARGAERFSAIARIENLCAFASYTLAVAVFALIARDAAGDANAAERYKNAVSLAVGAAILCLIAGEYVKTMLLQRYLRSEGLLLRAAAPTEALTQPLTQTLSQSFAGASIGGAIKRVVLSFRDALKGGRSSFVALQLFSVAQSRAGMYALIAFSTEAELGYFSATARFIIALRVLPGAAFQVLLPRFARTSSASAD